MSCSEKKALDRRSFLKGGVAASAAQTRSPSFSRSSSSTMMTRLPARISAMSSSTGLKEGMKKER